MRHFGIFGAVVGGWRFWVFSQAASHIVYGSLKSFSQQPTPAAFEQNLVPPPNTHKNKNKSNSKGKSSKNTEGDWDGGAKPNQWGKKFLSENSHSNLISPKQSQNVMSLRLG